MVTSSASNTRTSDWKLVLPAITLIVLIYLGLNERETSRQNEEPGVQRLREATTFPWSLTIQIPIPVGKPYQGKPYDQAFELLPFSKHVTMPTEPPKEEYLAFCIAARDQVLDLPEFLQHHYYHMNVSHFYIMDDNSNPPIPEDEDYYGVPSFALTFVHYTAEDDAAHPNGQMQWHIDDECMRLYGANHTWMGFIDVDEFLEVREPNETMESILREMESYPEVGALGINWITHTSAGLLTRPQSVRESFTTCLHDDENILGWEIGPIDKYIKSIVQTAKYDSVATAHQFNLKNGAITVGENRKIISPGNGVRLPIERERLALHHYSVKSRQEFEEKMARWKGDVGRKWDFWDNIEKVPSAPCFEMANRYVP